MSIQLLQEVHRIQDAFSSFTNTVLIIPSPITVITNFLSTAYMACTVAKLTFFKKPEPSYVMGSIINFTIGNHIALAAQVVLVIQRLLRIIDIKTEIEIAYRRVYVLFSCEFPLPEKDSWTAVAVRARSLWEAIKSLISSVGTYSWSLIDLTFSFCITSITQEDTKNNLLTNAFESYNDLKNNPTKISREIEANQPLIDWLLSELHAPINAKNISSLITSSIETGLFAAEQAENVLKQANSAFQTGAFVIGTIVAPESMSFITPSHKISHIHNSKDDCQGQLKPYNKRFFSTY